MYIVSQYNLRKLFKWISHATNRKWRDRRNGKHVGTTKMSILRMDVIHWAVGEEGRGSQVNVQRNFSVTHLSIRYIKQGVGVGQNPLSIVTKVICRCMLTVPKSELSFSLFFLFRFFIFFFLFFFFFFFFFFVPFFIQDYFYPKHHIFPR